MKGIPKADEQGLCRQLSCFEGIRSILNVFNV